MGIKNYGLSAEEAKLADQRRFLAARQEYKEAKRHLRREKARLKAEMNRLKAIQAQLRAQLDEVTRRQHPNPGNNDNHVDNDVVGSDPSSSSPSMEKDE